MSKRNMYIDATRGLAILLVILGHVIYFSDPDNVSHSMAFSIIYSFHMPLFFFISGFLVYDHFNYDLSGWIRKKFAGLVVPYLVFTFVYFYLLQWLKTSYVSISPGGLLAALFAYLKPDSAWFLPVLFEVLVLLGIMILIERWLGKSGVYVFPAYILLFAVFLPLTPLYNISGAFQVIHYSLFLVAGYYVNRYRGFLTGLDSRLGARLALLISALLFASLFTIRYVPLLAGAIDSVGLLSLYYGIAVAFAGITFSVALVRLLSGRILRSLAACGVLSLELYLTHLIILNYGGYLAVSWLGPGMPGVIASTVLILLTSLTATIILSWDKRVSRLLFGRWSLKVLKEATSKTVELAVNN